MMSNLLRTPVCQARRRIAAALAPVLVLPILLLAAGGCSGSADAEATAGGDAPAVETSLEVRRADFRNVRLLTGELRAERAVDLVVPKMPSWQVQLSWMEEDGAEVAAGDPVVEFDSSQFTSDLEEKRLSLREQENELQRLQAEGEVANLEKRFAIDQKRAELEKAATRADVPPDLLAERDYQERQLALRTAELELAKAEADLEAARASQRAELEMKRIEIEGARREIVQAESAVRSMTLAAPQAGIFVVQDHMWEPRKLKQGDMVHRGHTVARLPELSSMQVEASLSDVDDGKLAVGMEGDCVLDAYPSRAFPCRVASVSPVARESNRNSLLRFFEVRLELLEDDPEIMRPGMSVKASIVTDARDDALLAPRAALAVSGDPQRARLRGGGEVEVELGACNAHVCVVEGGLAAGDRLARMPAAAPPPDSSDGSDAPDGSPADGLARAEGGAADTSGEAG